MFDQTKPLYHLKYYLLLINAGWKILLGFKQAVFMDLYLLTIKDMNKIV